MRSNSESARRGIKKLSRIQRIVWLYQHAETKMMDIVREELVRRRKTVLASVHDAIFVRDRLSQSDLDLIVEEVRSRTLVKYFALSETQILRHS